MNTLLKQLSEQQNLQHFLSKLLNYLTRYFKTINLQSKQKTLQNINKICNKIQTKYLYQYSIDSLAKKLILNIQTKINDKEEEQESIAKNNNNNISKKTNHGMKSFIQNIQSTIQQQSQIVQVLSPTLLEPPTRLPSTQSDFAWIRKAVLEEIQLMQDDIKQADQKIQDAIEQVLGKNLGKNQKNYILFMESFLDNKLAIEKIKQLGWTPIIVKNQKKIIKDNLLSAVSNKDAQTSKKGTKVESKLQAIKQIQVRQISSYLNRTQSVIISADSITKTGGILSISGSLMLAIMCKNRKIPIIVLSRNYCLSDKILLNQKSLRTSINPLEFFNVSPQDFGTYITKDYDYVQGKYINLMITQRGSWNVENIAMINDQYWKY